MSWSRFSAFGVEFDPQIYRGGRIWCGWPDSGTWVVVFGGLDAWVSSWLGYGRRIGGVWVAGAAWVRSDDSFSRRRHLMAGDDARRWPVTSERERESETERGSARRRGGSGLRALRPDLAPYLYCFTFPFFWLN